MSKFLKSDFGYISILIILFLCFLPAFFMHQGLLLIDTGREFYIPSRILAGEALFKDIFIIYGPFSYLFNAFIMRIFGQSLYSIYIAGLFNSLLIILFIYLISAQFIKKNLSFLIALISIFSLVYNTFLYNSNLPYTYAISYALSFFLISVFCLIKYTKSDNILFARIAAIFGGLSLICKYEFLILPFIMLYVLLFIKPAGVKNILLSALLFLSPSLLCFTLIFLQGADVNNLFVNFSLLYKLITAPSLNIFFSKFGVFFNPENILFLLGNNFLLSAVGLLPIINLLMFIFFFKKIYSDKPLFIFTLCAISACLKSFFFLNVNHMGNFFFPICLMLTVFLAIKIKFPDNIIKITLIALFIFFCSSDLNSLKYKKYMLNTPKGTIYTFKKDGKMIKQAYDFIINNTNINDKVCILPEGVIINFLTERTADNFFYNLIPLLYDDVFGENFVIDRFSSNPPTYFIILPIDNIEYGKRFFGHDYAQKLYKIIKNNYNLIENKNNIQIFKKKEV